MIVGYAANKGYSQNVEQLEDAIRNSAFARNAELIPEISHDRIHELYARADAFIMTSIQEGQPVSAMEAGCGCVIDCRLDMDEMVRPMVAGGAHITDFLLR